MTSPTLTILTRKLDTLYGAYAPEFDVCSYGTCHDEAINNLAEEIRSIRGATAGRGTGYERKQA